MIENLPVKHLYAVELSGACQLESHCTWCPMSERPRYRPRGLMKRETVERSLYWAKKLGTKDPLALHVFGEPLLHPEFDTYASLFSDAGIPITMSTNALLLDERWADRLAKIPWKWISLSPWDRASVERASGLLMKRGIKIMWAPGNTHDWAGTAKGGKNSGTMFSCEFLSVGYCVIRWNGDVTTCCITDRDKDKCGTVFQEPSDVVLRSYSLCESCHLNRGG